MGHDIRARGDAGVPAGHCAETAAGSVPSSSDPDPIARLQSAREPLPVLEATQALARLETTLFGSTARGAVLDRYPLVRKLGQGACGVVYLAEDPTLDRLVAIKLLGESRRTEARRSRGRARLLREARAMAGAPHPNVVAIYDVGTLGGDDDDEPGVFLVMEYAQGPTLAQWLTTPRDWQQVLRVFVGAGHGLAAAHAVGVTHRDFKPANVIVTPEREESGGEDRTRVLDFGLASELPGEPSTSSGRHDAMSRSGDARLTEDGAIVGTPLYMAPEQHLQLPATPESDQFAFCVALWEALVGRPPFAAGSIHAIGAAKLAGPPPVPTGSSAPNWVFRVVRRGLSPEARDRWPSMTALLGELDGRGASRRSRRRLWLAAVVVAPSIVVGAVASWRDGATCPKSDALAAVWSPSRTAALAAAFFRTGVPYAEASFERLARRVEAYAADWNAAHATACHGPGEDPDAGALLDRRMACLGQQLQDVDAALAVLKDADAAMLAGGVELVAARLPEPARCNDDRHSGALAPPDDPELARQVAATRVEVAHARAVLDAGRAADALRVTEGLAQRAQAIDHAPLLAEVLAVHGAAQAGTGRYADAVDTLERAHAVALACRHDAAAAEAAVHLVFAHGDRLGDLDAALSWAATAEAELQRAGRSRERWALLNALGTAHEVAGRFEDALGYAQEAMAVASDDATRAATHNNLGHILRRLGRFPEARAELERALSIYERVHGEQHPDVASALNNLGSVDLFTGDAASAEASFRRVLSIREALLGADHVQVGAVLSNLGVAVRRQGRLEEARAIHQRALALLERQLSVDDPRLAAAFNSIAAVEAEAGDYAAALRYLDRAVVLLELQLDPHHPDLGMPLQNRAEALLRTGRPADAVEAFARAIANKIANNGREHFRVAQARRKYARVLAEAGQPEAALLMVSTAVAELDADAWPDTRAELDAWLAEARQRYPGEGGP